MKKKIKKNSAMRKIVSMLAKDTIKRQVPIQVFRDCADVINKALYHDRTAIK